MFRWRAAILVALLVLFGCSEPDPAKQPDRPETPAEVKREQEIVVGSISVAIADEVADFQPFADYLARHLADRGILRGRVVVTTAIDAMGKRLGAGDVDLYVDSPFPVALLARRIGCIPMLRRWKKGVAEYRTVIFARADSGIASLDDLRGRVVAFDDPFSTSGYLVPKAILLDAGLRVVEIADPKSSAPADSAAYVFSKDDENTMFWVRKRRVDAGAMDEDQYLEFSENLANEFRVVHRSEPVPRHVVARRSGLDPALAGRIEEILLGMHEDPEGARILREFHKTTRFDRFPNGATAALAGVEKHLDRIARDLGG